jgi:hypothetical protein
MIQPAREKQRSFGRGVGVVLMLIGGYQLVRGRSWGTWLVATGALLTTLGTFAPGTLAVPSDMWWRFALALGWLNSRILLSVFFFLIVTPTGLVLRLFGYDPLLYKGPRDGSTWVPYSVHTSNPKHYDRLF